MFRKFWLPILLSILASPLWGQDTLVDRLRIRAESLLRCASSSHASAGRFRTPSPQVGAAAQPVVSKMQLALQRRVPPPRPNDSQVLPARSKPSQLSPVWLMKPSPQTGAWQGTILTRPEVVTRDETLTITGSACIDQQSVVTSPLP